MRCKRFLLSLFLGFFSRLFVLSSSVFVIVQYVYVNNFFQPQPDDFVGDLFNVSRSLSSSFLLLFSTLSCLSERLGEALSASGLFSPEEC